LERNGEHIMNEQQARHFKSICRHMRVHVQQYANRLSAFEYGSMKDIKQVPVSTVDELFDREYQHMIKECDSVLWDMRSDLYETED
jgi:hypothetical protein